MCRDIRIIVRFVHVILSLVTIFVEAMLKVSRMPFSYRLCFTRKESFFSFFSLTLHAIYVYIRVLLTNRFFSLHDYLNYVTIELLNYGITYLRFIVLSSLSGFSSFTNDS